MDRTITLTPIRVGTPDLDDPRRELGETALALASRNAFPVVASRTARKDGAASPPAARSRCCSAA